MIKCDYWQILKSSEQGFALMVGSYLTKPEAAKKTFENASREHDSTIKNDQIQANWEEFKKKVSSEKWDLERVEKLTEGFFKQMGIPLPSRKEKIDVQPLKKKVDLKEILKKHREDKALKSHEKTNLIISKTLTEEQKIEKERLELFASSSVEKIVLEDKIDVDTLFLQQDEEKNLQFAINNLNMMCDLYLESPEKVWKMMEAVSGEINAPLVGKDGIPMILLESKLSDKDKEDLGEIGKKAMSGLFHQSSFETEVDSLLERLTKEGKIVPQETHKSADTADKKVSEEEMDARQEFLKKIGLENERVTQLAVLKDFEMEFHLALLDVLSKNRDLIALVAQCMQHIQKLGFKDNGKIFDKLGEFLDPQQSKNWTNGFREYFLKK